MIVLVTGASGFVGMNLLLHLAVAHPDARLVACDLSPLQSSIEGVAYHKLDVSDRVACLRLLDLIRPTHVVHAAAVTPSVEGRIDVSVNLHGTRHMVAAALAVGTVLRFLFLSSSGVYEHTRDDRPCDEEHPLLLDSPYAFYKREAELHGLQYGQGLDFVVGRVGPVYGPYETPRTTRPVVSLIGCLADALIDGRGLTIAGDDSCRDWTYASDVSAGLDLLLTAKTLRHRIYNVSCGVAVRARTIIAAFVERDLHVTWVEDHGRADLVLAPKQDRKPLDITRLRNDTNFHPAYDLQSGLNDLIEKRARYTRKNSAFSGNHL